MVFMGRRAARGRRGKSLILVGLVIFLIGLAITVGSYALAASRGGGTYFVSWGFLLVGIVSMIRGTIQAIADRRAGVSGGPAQGIPPYGQPGPYGQPQPGQQPSYDQPGYAMPRNPEGPQDTGRPPGA